MKCPNCDRENRDVARFCQYCGASLAPAESPDVLPEEMPPTHAEPLPELPVEPFTESPATHDGETPQAPVNGPAREAAELPSPPDPVAEPVSTLHPAEPATRQESPDADQPSGEGETGKVAATEAAQQTVAETSAPDIDIQETSLLEEAGPSDATPHLADSIPGQEAIDTTYSELLPDADAADTSVGASPDVDDQIGEQNQESNMQEPEYATNEEQANGQQESDIARSEPAGLESIPDELSTELEEFTAAGLLPWSDDHEPTSTPLPPLEPGTVVSGRYQVIELVQPEDQQARYRVRDLQQCPRCGFTDNSPDEAFCASCGALMDQKPVAMMVERVEQGDEPPSEAQEEDIVAHEGRHYWVWHETEPEPSGEAQPLMQLILGQRSDTGQVRKLDEDSMLVLTMSATYESATHQVALFIVADGMGGHEGGEIASCLAIQRLSQALLNDVFSPELMGNPLSGEAILRHMEKAVLAANDRVYLERQKRENDMGTTVTVALVVDWTLYLAHVGDCRAYRWGEDGLQQLTTDHSIVAGMVAAGTIEPDEVYTHPQRSVIYRSIGDRPHVEVDLDTLTLSPGDRLVLCCDGLWEMIRNEGIEDVLLLESDPQRACDIMIEQANLAGGSDNISVIIVQL